MQDLTAQSLQMYTDVNKKVTQERLYFLLSANLII